MYRGGRSRNATYFIDRDSTHKSKSTMAFYEKENIKVKINGPKYCDFNPAEQAISVLKARVRSRNPKGVNDLKSFIRQEWANMEESYFQALIDSMPRRFEECLERGGRMTHWGSNMKRT